MVTNTQTSYYTTSTWSSSSTSYYHEPGYIRFEYFPIDDTVVVKRRKEKINRIFNMLKLNDNLYKL